MKAPGFFSSILLTIFLVLPGLAQTQIVRGDFYPAEMEFSELQKIQADENVRDAASLARIRNGDLFADVGFEQYSKRSYALADRGSLTIEVVTLKDTKAAYSILTLLRNGNVAPGPPGEFYCDDGNDLSFVRGAYLVRLHAEARPDLLKRVGTSVSNRIGQRETSFPTLIGHFPKKGYDASSVRYFLGPKSYDSFSTAAQRLKFESGMEVAQARYTVDNQTGLLSLISFPTHEMAEGYQESLEVPVSNDSKQVYVKRAGPLVGVLEGTFDHATADGLLSSIHFSYAIKWIYNKDNQSSKTIWGVPMPILHTVVRSIALVAILCLASILVGASFGLFRLWLRRHAPHNILDRPERTEMIRLKLGPPQRRDDTA